VPMRHYLSDVVVIGGGLAGIVAALELLDAG
jgi:succinate dehydrogenase/fumarate reductase flavoprotein subunit